MNMSRASFGWKRQGRLKIRISSKEQETRFINAPNFKQFFSQTLPLSKIRKIFF